MKKSRPASGMPARSLGVSERQLSRRRSAKKARTAAARSCLQKPMASLGASAHRIISAAWDMPRTAKPSKRKAPPVSRRGFLIRASLSDRQSLLGALAQDLGAQRLGLVGLLPLEAVLLAAEVAEGRRGLVDGPAQLEGLDDALGRHREELADG